MSKFKFNPLTGDFNIVPDSGTLIQKLNPVTGDFNITKEAGKYKQVLCALSGEFNLRPAVTQVIIHGVGSIQLTNAVENGLLSLKAFGGTEQSNLPGGYTQVEYITFDGQSFIDTGYTVSLNDEIQAKLKFTVNGFIYGASTSIPRVTLYGSPGGNQRWGDKYVSVSGIPAYTTDLVIKHNKDALIINDTTMAYASQEDFTTSETLTIGNDNGNTTTNLFNGDLYYFKFFKNGVLVRDYIPAKDSNNVVGLFDRVSGTFFTNDGTGTLTAGPNAVPTPTTPVDIVCNNGAIKAKHQSGLPLGYTLLDSVTGDGLVGIDTGLKLQAGDEIDLDYEWLGAPSGQSSDRFFLGTSNADTSKGGCWAELYTSNGLYSGWYVRFSSLNSVTTPTDMDTQLTGHLTLKQESFAVNNVKILAPSYVGTFQDTTLTYFGRFNATGDTFVGAYIKISKFTLKNNGVYRYYGIPCKNSSNVIGMYDLVSGTFGTKVGTGTFTAGNTVSDPIEIYTDGTTETINVYGKNLFNKAIADENRVYGYFASSGRTWSYASAGFSIRIPCKPNTKYTARYNGDSTQAVLGFGSTFNDDVPSNEVGSVTVTQGIRKISPTINDPITITTGENDKWLIVAYNVAEPQHSDMADNLQVEEGQTATEYQPYYNGGTATAEMLLKVGDYVDEQEILSGNITRKIGVRVLTGDNTKDGLWGTSAGASNLYSLSIANSSTDNTFYPISTHFEGILGSIGYASIQDGQFKHGSNSYTYFFKHTSSENITTFKAYLATQYANGTPVIIVYPLAAPTTETVEGQSLTIPEGDSTIEITQASLDNLELEATYEQEA